MRKLFGFNLGSDRLLLLCIFLVALLLGLGNIFYDWPLSNTIGDEYESLRVALSILDNRQLFQGSYYPPLWAWLQLPVAVISIAVLLLSGVFPDLSSLRTAVILNPGLLLAGPRLFSAILSAAGVFVIYKIGKLIDSKRTGFLAAWVYAISFIRFQLAHSGRVNSAFFLFSLLGLYFCLAYIRNHKTKYWYLTLLFIVLSSLTYHVGVVLFVLPLWALIQLGKWKTFLRSPKKIILSAIILLPVTFIVSEPLIIMTHIANTSFVSSNMNIVERMIYHLKAVLFHETLFAVIAVMGLFNLFKSKKKYFFSIFAYCFFPFLLFSIVMGTPKVRFSFLFIPVVALCAGYWINTRKKVGMLILALASVFSLALGLRLNWLTFKKTTFIEAKNWVEENVPFEANLLVEIDIIGIVPSANASMVIAAHERGYHRTQRNLLIEKDINSSLVKNVFFYIDLKTMLPENEFKKIIKEKEFDYIVSFSCYKNGSQIWSEIDSRNYHLHTQFRPTESTTQISHVLGTSRPFPDLFRVKRYGFCINIYERNNQK